MSKFLKFLFLIIFLGLVGGFIYLSIVDVPVTQEPVTTETTLKSLNENVSGNE